jgi:hypothetical protein
MAQGKRLAADSIGDKNPDAHREQKMQTSMIPDSRRAEQRVATLQGGKMSGTCGGL